MSDTCPFCGAEPKTEWDVFDYPADYDCGTLMEGAKHKPVRSSECYKRQIAALQAEVARLKERAALRPW